MFLGFLFGNIRAAGGPVFEHFFLQFKHLLLAEKPELAGSHRPDGDLKQITLKPPFKGRARYTEYFYHVRLSDFVTAHPRYIANG